MKVFKFGGASVKDAAAVENVAKVIKQFPNRDLVVVISAMGKTTNALEDLLAEYASGGSAAPAKLKAIIDFHKKIAADLKIPDSNLEGQLDALFGALRQQLEREPSDNYDFDYDQVVSYGELVSTAIISAYLRATGLDNTWADARRLIRTDNRYREGRVNWVKTEKLATDKWAEVKSASKKSGRSIMLTQGFIGHTDERNTTTLGREGSDFTAAIFAFVLNAVDVTIWKDVPGVLNADPKYFKDAVLLKRISYREAIELAYYGASVIHPKTIKPLQNKNIPLYVRSFLNPSAEGTVIESSTFSDSLMPSYIFKVNQVLISFTPRDFSFVAEDNLSELFSLFAEYGMKIHLMQNSAINFSVCVDHASAKLAEVMERCKERYEVLYNQPCELVTIRHYDQDTISRLLIGKKVLVEQKSRSTARMVLVEN
ncbi:MAG: aspartate kinase [Cryomorphaceae bacterium]|nr:aspartate kinase [Flavobacteriales bacterium]